MFEPIKMQNNNILIRLGTTFNALIFPYLFGPNISSSLNLHGNRGTTGKNEI